MEQTTPQTEKLNLQNNTPSPLKIYLFILRKPKIKIDEEKSAIVLAYNLDSALIKATQMDVGWNVHYHGQNMPVKNLIDALYLEQTILPQTNSEPIEIPKEKIGLEGFKAGLLLAANDLLKEPEDKQKLKEIINKL